MLRDIDGTQFASDDRLLEAYRVEPMPRVELRRHQA